MLPIRSHAIYNAVVCDRSRRRRKSMKPTETPPPAAPKL
ncbi:MarR family transcriptional regulator, partial [Bacteroides thetaiotaomicron]|nr:MarR family transcriptional regulator [Bacteroides thetaiotaomicron]